MNPGLRPRTGRVFAGLTEHSLDKKLKASGGNGYTVHGMRSTFSGDWAAKAGYSLELRDRALAHKVGNDVSGRYNRDTLLEQRREMMQAGATTPRRSHSMITRTRMVLRPSSACA